MTAGEKLLELAQTSGPAGVLFLSVTSNPIKYIFADTVCVLVEESRFSVVQQLDDITVTQHVESLIVELPL